MCREGRRASDGLVAQGIVHSQSEYPINSPVVFNSLHETYKSKGILELHLLQQEAAKLKNQYQANLPADEMTVRQMQHSQFHVNPNRTSSIDISTVFHSGASMMQKQNIDGSSCSSGYGKVGEMSSFVGIFKNEICKLDQMEQQLQSPLQKPPLQQQLMQHRLLQQKRQILQKQVAMETGLSRRQMFRQQSYKIAQQQNVLPPIPLNEHECEDLLAFQAIVEGPASTSSLNNGLPKMMKTSHIQHHLPPPGDCWNTLPGSMQTCQLNDTGMSHEAWVHPAVYQVYYNGHR